jgi:predicted nucleotidyltransferase component of viral defense system
MTDAPKGLPVSVQVCLVQHAKATGIDPNVVLARYAAERFLYRLSRSSYADRFVLKGALLMLVWLGETIRPTRDADLLGFGEISRESLAKIFTDVCKADVEPDGLEYLPSSIRIAPIRQEDAYGGLRATIQARLGSARLHVQVDVGIGDAVVPEPEWLDYPSLLEFPQARLKAYRPETAITEKLHAMVTLGEANSRMRDFFDIHALSENRHFDGGILARAVRATFQRRRTLMPGSLPLAMTPAFAAIRSKQLQLQLQWQGFLRKSGISSAPTQLSDVIARIAVFLEPIITAARGSATLKLAWMPGGPWVESSSPLSGKT